MTRRDRRRALPARLGGAAAPLARAARGPTAGRRAARRSACAREARPRRCSPPTSRRAGCDDPDGRRRAARDDRPGAARAGPLRLPAGVLPSRWSQCRHAAAALRPAPRRADHAHRPRQPALAATSRRRFALLAAARLPLLGVHLHRRSEPERITGAWLLRKPTVHDVALTAGSGPRLHHLALGSPSPTASCALCDQLGGAHWHATRSSAGPGATASRTRSSCTSATRTATASSSTRATTTRATPTTSRCAGRSTDPRCRSFWGTRAPDSLVRRELDAARARRPAGRDDGGDGRRARSALGGDGLNNFRTQRPLSVLRSRPWESTTSRG